MSRFRVVALALLFAVTVAGCGGGSSTSTADMDGDGMTMPEPTAYEMALMGASTALQTALGALSGTPTQAQIDAAGKALADLNTAIEEAADLSDADKAPHQLAAANARGRIDGAKQALMAANDAKEEQRRKDEQTANAAMADTAAKLYEDISSAPTKEGALYKDADESMITVKIGGKPTDLSEDKRTMVADNHGWAGKKYTDEPAGGGTYEAVVYSNVGAATEGEKFSVEYKLKSGEVAVDILTTGAVVWGRVASSSFDQSAGQKRFKLPDPNPNAAKKITVSGSYHGVSGTYSCTPGDGGNTCAADVAKSGFRLGTVDNKNGKFQNTLGDWMFTPTNPNTRVMDVADPVYASYGWWLHKSADGQAFTASAFVGEKGNVGAPDSINDLDGKATYMGGAAGKYALSSSTGGTNDAGHFTARATLQADFTNNTAATAITGTIDQFVGADGESRDWEVELKGSAIKNDGKIGDADRNKRTVWTIGGTAADASGQWSGSLRNNDGTDGVPQVATGTLYTEYGTAGRMVGAFGANKQ